MKKCFILVLALLLMVSAAFAEPRYPDKAEPISDFANVFSKETIDALNAFNTNLKSKTGATLHVVTVHFLDGADARSYSNELFTRWNLGTNDILLLLAVGEDSFFTAAGQALNNKFPETSREVLLSDAFLARYLALDYDGAIREYIPKLAEVLGKNYGAAIALPKFFGAAEAPATSTAKPIWMDIFEFEDKPVRPAERREENRIERIEREAGINLPNILLLVLILLLIFSPRKSVRQFGQMAGCSSCGCGCGPIGWILALLGLREATKKRK